MYDICCVGHITLDKVVTPRVTAHMAGGTSFYFSNAIRNMDVSYTLVTTLAESEMVVVEKLRAKGINVNACACGLSVYFENIYSENQDHRTQRVLQKANPFTVEQLQEIDAQIFHLGPLLADDMPVELIKELNSRGKVSLDVQGYLRKVEDKNVVPIDWADKREALQYIDILKANEHETEVLTGSKDIHEGARILADWGVKEVVLTLGSMGSVIYTGGVFYNIPAYKPSAVVDATGCGDTYMAGYLYQRIKGASFQQAGEFAAAMASFKIESSGPFTGTEDDVLSLIARGEKTYAY
ncbi:MULTISPECIES: PfkB family carbohydrate kinase [unclassified Mucilaginibacter]|uniref:PfkB family carbohydrate kinase n=1 Tax=unclassified Mucilaginibacter TaxID=2617802 RepID=UPI0008B09926|nr:MULTISPECIES: PfkB family carbohydrate kinase [unclassified Mucilaginibacter]WDF78195.1 PfkB family carbohydrate kinase [Mucilaginibacter sp. KACC 22773]SEO07120.1 Sugar or nucleoside kinase, ribokinase family [Mucilaginibacter sp. OK283]